MVISPNDAYLQTGPWWITIFTGSLLLSAPATIQGNLAPGFCPYRPRFNLEQINKMQTLMKSVFGDINEYFSYIQPEVESLPTNSFPSTSSGYLERSSVQDDDYFIRIITNEVGEFVVENIRTELNIQLRITIVISLILAILLTVSMVAFAVIWLLDSFQKLSQKSQHF